MFIEFKVASLTRPVQRLSGVQCMMLQPGETQRMTFTLTDDMLALTGGDCRWAVEPGGFQLGIAPDNARGLGGEFSR